MRRGIEPSRERARIAIAEGRVTVGGAPAMKPSRLVEPSEPIEVAGPGRRFVSRGGEKLDAALDRFAVSVQGRRALDAGASTGGFTDCLLQRGASTVVAVDVGYGQLHERLVEDARVEVRERTNVRHLRPEHIGGRTDLVCADLSFISLRTVLRALVDLSEPGGDLIVLVKPQFEAGKQEASKGRGVITDPAVWRRVLEEVRGAAQQAGAAMMGAMVSPLRGAEGNVEFLAHLRRTSEPGPVVDLDVVVAEAVATSGR